MNRDHDRGREEVGFAGRADRYLVRRCFPRFVAIIPEAQLLAPTRAAVTLETERVLDVYDDDFAVEFMGYVT